MMWWAGFLGANYCVLLSIDEGDISGRQLSRVRGGWTEDEGACRPLGALREDNVELPGEKARE